MTPSDDLARFVRAQRGLWSFALDAPSVPAWRLFGAFAAHEDAHYLRGELDESAGAGVVRRIEVAGAGRERALLAALAELRASKVQFGGGAEAPARLFGGLAFDERAAEPPWEGFSSASFVWPRWCYRKNGGASQLVASGEGDDPRPYLAELDRIWTALLEPGSPARSARVQVERDDPRAFLSAVELGLSAIGEGTLEKVVLSRRIRARADFDGVQVIARLVRERRGVAFAFRRGGRWFLGSTPELLVKKEGRVIESEALAGTRPLGDEPFTPKDLREHAFVVDHVSAVLRGLGVEPAIGPCVELALRHVRHLHTPIAGRAPDEHLSLVELACALHPTPAVAGVPCASARALISRVEDGPRGWYAAPIGWIDPGGDGALWVALRSALVGGAEALCFVGAGVVAGSIPEREWAETEWKAKTALSALGGA